MSYNQAARNQSVRIGNWFEELRLQSETGVRYYSDPKLPVPAAAGTRERCFVHTEQTLPKDYSSTVRDGYVDPKSRPESKWAQRGQGPRAKLIEKSLGETVETQMKAATEAARLESMRVDYTSETRSRYQKANFTPYLKMNDASIRHFTPHANFVFDLPITIYSDAMMKGYMAFPSSFVCANNPFRKNNRFSIPDKISTSKSKAECNERPRPLPTPQDFMIIHRFRNRLITHVKATLNLRVGGTIRTIITSLWQGYIADQPEGREDSYILFDFDEVLRQAFNFNVEPREKTSILSCFEATGNNGGVALVDFSVFLRPLPDLRRLELVQDMFKTLNKSLDSEVRLDKDVIRSKYRGEDDIASVIKDFNAIRGAHITMPCASPNKQRERVQQKEIIASPNSIASSKRDNNFDSPAKVNTISGSSGDVFTIDDFIDYYCDISAEMKDATDFENYLIASWSV